MQIKLNGVTLCAGGAGGAEGDPVGPEGINIRLSPGTENYEYLNADGIEAEHVGCDSCAVSFGVTRTYGTVAQAQTVAIGMKAAAPRQGALEIDGAALLAKATLRDLDIRQIGCSLVMRYSVEGF